MPRVGIDYCTLADVLAAVSQEAQARLTTDPERWWEIGIATATPAATWDTPFAETTVLEAAFNGTPQTSITVTKGTGPNGTDRLTFATAPTNGTVVTARADASAINTAVVIQAIQNASDALTAVLVLERHPITDQLKRDILRPKAVFLVRWALRDRRNLDESSPVMREYDALQTWMLALSKGDAFLPGAAAIAIPSGRPYASGEPVHYFAPSGSNISTVIRHP